MLFDELLEKLNTYSKTTNFKTASSLLNDEILKISSKGDFEHILQNIGTIPEEIKQNSTEEKLFAKMSDSVLSKAFQLLGLKSVVMTDRANAADVLAESEYHGYSLVADAKAFRLSRTARNQKDFKVSALSTWRQEMEYSVLCSPYYQYPSKRSQIYEQALKDNVCLLSWEHILFLIKHDIKEDEDCDLSFIWGFSGDYSSNDQLKFNERNLSFFNKKNSAIVQMLNLDLEDLETVFESQRNSIFARGEVEKSYWKKEIDLIKKFTREEAIEQLIKCKKIEEKIKEIDKFMERLQ